MIQLQNYCIQVQEKDFEQLQEQLILEAYSKVFVLVDNNTKIHCLPILREALKKIELHIITIKAGETYKNIEKFGWWCYW